jgi:hypothetical protein
VEDPTVETLAESENFGLWRAEETDGETTYHLEMGPVTVHFLREEWQELLGLIEEVNEGASAG